MRGYYLRVKKTIKNIPLKINDIILTSCSECCIFRQNGDRRRIGPQTYCLEDLEL